MHYDNPMGLDGFEFVEFSAPEKGLIEPGYLHPVMTNDVQ